MIRSPEVKSLPLNFQAPGDTTIIPASSGPIYVYGIVFTVSGATSITFKDGVTPITGAIAMTAFGSSINLPPFGASPFFWTSVGNPFVINLTVGVLVSGIIYYTS